MYHIFPFHLIEKGTDIVLYGAGIAGRNFLLQIQRLDYCNVVCIADKGSQKKNICNIDVVSPNDLNNYIYDKIVITPIKKETQEEIKNELIMFGIPEEKIISYVSDAIDWERPKIKFLNQHEEYLWALKNDNYLEKIDPRILVVSDRIDIVVRYLLFRDYVNNVENNAHLSLYTRYVLCRTGGHEYSSYYSDEGKNTVQMYIDRGKQLCESIMRDGFNAEHFIPLKYNTRACDGLHRIAASIAANEKIWVKRYEDDFEYNVLDVDLGWFEKEGFLFEDCVRILRGFTEIYRGKCGIFVLYATMEDMWQYMERQIALQFKVVGKADFDYAENYLSFQNVLRQIYFDIDKSNDWLTRKLDLLILAPLKYRVIVVSDEDYQSDDFYDAIRKLKIDLRKKLSMDVNQQVPILLHASDSEEEFIHLKKIFLSANNYFWQDKRLKQYYAAEFFEKLNALKIWCDSTGIDRDDVCVVGSGVLELLGLRKANNLNVIVKAKYDIKERIYRGKLEILEFDYCLDEKKQKICNDIIIDDDEYHMVFADVKFCNLEFVYRYKKIRGKEKDKIDLAKMDAWYDFGRNFDNKKALRKRVEIEMRKRGLVD